MYCVIRPGPPVELRFPLTKTLSCTRVERFHSLTLNKSVVSVSSLTRSYILFGSDMAIAARAAAKKQLAVDRCLTSENDGAVSTIGLVDEKSSVVPISDGNDGEWSATTSPSLQWIIQAALRAGGWLGVYGSGGGAFFG